MFLYDRLAAISFLLPLLDSSSSALMSRSLRLASYERHVTRNHIKCELPYPSRTPTALFVQPSARQQAGSATAAAA